MNATRGNESLQPLGRFLDHAQVGVALHIELRMHEAELLRQIDILLQRADVRQQLRIAVIVNAGLRSRLGSRSPKRVSTMGLDASRPRRHHRHPVGEVDRFLHVMGDEDHRLRGALPDAEEFGLR